MINRLNSKWVWRCIFWLITAVLAVNLGRLAYQGWVPRKVQAASGRPYTVLRTESGFDKRGTLRYTNNYVEALRADGSNMWSATTSLVQQRTINFANGDQVLTNELIRKMSTYPKNFAAVPVRRDPEASCLSESAIKTGWIADGTETIGGYRAARQVLKASNRTLIAWHALDVGCALLQQRLEHQDGITVQNLASLILGEPSPALFNVSPDFQEVPPSGLYEPLCKGGSCKSLPEPVKQRLDDNYYQVRSKAP